MRLITIDDRLMKYTSVGTISTASPKLALIEAALPRLRFQRIPVLFYTAINERTTECEEVVEFGPVRGILLLSSQLPMTIVAGNRVANSAEIWLHADGTLHEYLEMATWEALETGCTQRQYVGPVTEARISLGDLKEQIDCNLADDYEVPWEDSDNI